MDSVFNDNSLSFGSRFEKFVTANAIYSVEGITLNYPTKTIEKSDPIGQPYGFVLVKGQPTGSCVIQVSVEGGGPPAVGGNVTTMPANGDYFIDNFKSANEKWVISSLGVPYEQNGYRKVNANLIQALFSGST